MVFFVNMLKCSTLIQKLNILPVFASRACANHAHARKVSAYGVTNNKSPLELMKIGRRALDKDDVGIDIEYCGICHTDLHFIRDEWNDSGVPTAYPFVPGHEIIGKISEVGSNVKKLKVGDQVGGKLCDKQCEFCKSGDSQYCPTRTFVFNSPYDKDKPEPHTYGGFSNFIVTDHRYVNTIPKGLDIGQAPPLLCAGVTVFSPLKQWNVGKGTKLAVYGVGGLGHLAVKLGAAMGAEVTVLSRSDKRKAEAIRLGAHDLVVTTSAESLASRSGYFDVILDCVSSPHDIDSLINLLRIRTGALAMVGLPDKPLNFTAHNLAFGSKKVSGSLVGSIAEAQEVVDFCGKHNVLPECEIISIKDVNEAMKRLAKSDVKYRFVIDMATLK